MQDDPEKKSDTHESIKRGLSFVEQTSSSSMKLERSRTIANSGRFRSRGQKMEAMLGNNTKLNADLIPSAVTVDKSCVQQLQSATSSKDSIKPIINDLSQGRNKHHHGNGDKHKRNVEFII